jgi:hypothetical protein
MVRCQRTLAVRDVRRLAIDSATGQALGEGVERPVDGPDDVSMLLTLVLVLGTHVDDRGALAAQLLH